MYPSDPMSCAVLSYQCRTCIVCVQTDSTNSPILVKKDEHSIEPFLPSFLPLPWLLMAENPISQCPQPSSSSLPFRCTVHCSYTRKAALLGGPVQGKTIWVAWSPPPPRGASSIPIPRKKQEEKERQHLHHIGKKDRRSDERGFLEASKKTTFSPRKYLRNVK